MPRSSATFTVTATVDSRKLSADVRRAVRKAERSAPKINVGGRMSGGRGGGANLRPLGSGLSAATANANEFTKAMEASNARVIAFGASAGIIYGVARAMSEVVKSTVDVEKRLKDINVILGETSSGLARVGSELFRIAGKTGQSFQTVSEAMSELARQGLGTESSLKRVRDAMILVRITGMDAKSAVESLTAAINGFNEAGLDSTAVVNRMANVDAAFAVSSNDLAEALKRAGSTAKEAGVSFNQLIAIVTAAQQNTARGGAVIGNAFKSIFTKIQRPKTLEMLEMIGIKTKQTSGQMKSTLHILEELAQKYDTLSHSQQSHITQLMGGLYQVNTLKSAIRDLSSQYSIYRNALDVANKSTDQAIRRNDELNSTIAALINETVQNMKQFAAGMGKSVAGPALKKVFDTVNGIMSAISNLDPDSGIGKTVTGLFEGIGKMISGPGMAVGLALIGKLVYQFAGFLKQSVSSLLGINTLASQQATLQKEITGLLSANPKLIGDAVAKGMNFVQVQNMIVQKLKEEQIIRAQISQQIMRMAAMGPGLMMGTAGMALKGRPPTPRNWHSPFPSRTRSEGHIPSFSSAGPVSEGIGAAMGGYKAGPIKQMSMPGLGRVTYNGAEKVKHVPGFSQPFINPPLSSKAGKQHRTASMAQTGINPYVPNFSVFRNIATKIPGHLGYGMSRKEQTEVMQGISKWAGKANKNDLTPMGRGIDGAFFKLGDLPWGIKAFHTRTGAGSRSGTGPGIQIPGQGTGAHGLGRNPESVLAGMRQGTNAGAFMGGSHQSRKNYGEYAMLAGMGNVPASVRREIVRGMGRGLDVPLGIFGKSSYPVTPGIGMFPQAGMIKPIVNGVELSKAHRESTKYLISQGVNPLMADSIGAKVHKWANRYPAMLMEEKAMVGQAGLGKSFLPSDLHAGNIMISNDGIKMASNYMQKTGGVPKNGQSLFDHEATLLKQVSEGGHLHVVDPGHFKSMPKGINPSKYFDRIHPSSVGAVEHEAAANIHQVQKILGLLKRGEAPVEMGSLFGLKNYKPKNVTQTSGEITGIPGFNLTANFKKMVERYLMLKHPSMVKGASGIKAAPAWRMGTKHAKRWKNPERRAQINEMKFLEKQLHRLGGQYGSKYQVPELMTAMKTGDLVSVREWLVPTAMQKRKSASLHSSFSSTNASPNLPKLPSLPKPRGGAPRMPKPNLPPMPKPRYREALAGKDAAGKKIDIDKHLIEMNKYQQAETSWLKGSKQSEYEIGLGELVRKTGVLDAVRTQGAAAFNHIPVESAFGRMYTIGNTGIAVKMPRDVSGAAFKKANELGLPGGKKSVGRWDRSSPIEATKLDSHILANEVLRYAGDIPRNQTGILGKIMEQKGKFSVSRVGDFKYSDVWKAGTSENRLVGEKLGGFVSPESEAIIAQKLAEMGAPIPGISQAFGKNMPTVMPLSGGQFKVGLHRDGDFNQMMKNKDYIKAPTGVQSLLRKTHADAQRHHVREMDTRMGIQIGDAHGGNAMFSNLDKAIAKATEIHGKGLLPANAKKKMLEWAISGKGQDANFKLVDIGSMRISGKGKWENLGNLDNPFQQHGRLTGMMPYGSGGTSSYGAPVRGFAKGFIPGFSPLSDAIGGEKRGIQMGGKGGTPRIGHDPRVGVGVYTSTQGSLSAAINQHLAAGQPRSTLGSSGMGLQGKSQGHVPSFFEGGGMEMGMMMSMMAMGFMGQAGQAGKANKAELREIKKKADADEKRARKLYERERQQLNKIEAEKKRLMKAEGQNVKTARLAYQEFKAQAAATTSGAMAPGTGGLYNQYMNAARGGYSGGFGGWKMEQEDRLRRQFEQAKMQHQPVAQEQKDAKATQKARLQQAKADAERLKIAKQDAANALKPKDPFTGKALQSWKESKGGYMKGMMSRGLGAGNKFAMPMAFAGPMIGGMMAGNVNTNTREGRMKAAGVQAAGTGAGMAGMGMMVGGMVGSGAAAVAIGGGIGIAAGLALWASAVEEAATDQMPDLAEAAEKAAKQLNDFNNSTGRFSQALTSYQQALLDPSGRQTPGDLNNRRTDLMETMMGIPSAERGGILSNMYAPDKLATAMAKAQRRLSAKAETEAQRKDTYEMARKGEPGLWSSFAKDSSWTTGFGLLDLPASLIGQDTGSRMQRKVDDSQETRLQNSGQFARKGFRTYGDLNRLIERPSLTSSTAGEMQLESMGDKFFQTFDYSNIDLNKSLKALESITSKTGDAAWESAAGMKELFDAFGGDSRILENLKIDEINALAVQFKSRMIDMLAAEEYTKISKRVIETQRDHLGKLKTAHEEYNEHLADTTQKIASYIARMATLHAGREEINLGRANAARNLKTSEMGMQIAKMSPFLGSRSKQNLTNMSNMSGAMSQNAGALEQIDASYKLGLQKGITDVFKRTTDNMTKAFDASIGGDDARRQELELKASKTKPAADAMSLLMDLVDKRMAGGGGTGTGMLDYVTGQIDSNASLSVIKNDSALRNKILESLEDATLSSNIALIKQQDAMFSQVRLLEMQNKYSVEMISLMANLELLGGIEEFSRGTHTSLGRIDELADAMNAISVSPGIQEGRAALGLADFMKNSLGMKDLPPDLVGTAVAGRAQQMAQAATYAEQKLGVDLGDRGWMKEPESDKLLGIAMQQVAGQLKDILPQKIEEVKQELVSLSLDLTRESQAQSTRMQPAMKNALVQVLGTGSTSITGGTTLGGLNSTISNLLNKQTLLQTAQSKQQEAFRHAGKGVEAGARGDNARLEAIQRFNRVFEFSVGATSAPGGSSMSPNATRTHMSTASTGGNKQGLDWKTTSMADAQGSFKSQTDWLKNRVRQIAEQRFRALETALDDEAWHGGVDQTSSIEAMKENWGHVAQAMQPGSGTSLPNALRMYQGAMQEERTAPADVKASMQANAVGTEWATGPEGQIAIANTENLIKEFGDLYTGGRLEGLRNEYNQQQVILQQANADRATAEAALVNTINQANQQYKLQMQLTVGPQNKNLPHGSGTPVVTPHYNRGGVVYASKGMFTPKGSDTVPAMLTPNEYVVNAKSSKKHRGLLDKINYMAGGGSVGGMDANSWLKYIMTQSHGGPTGAPVPFPSGPMPSSMPPAVMARLMGGGSMNNFMPLLGQKMKSRSSEQQMYQSGFLGHRAGGRDPIGDLTQRMSGAAYNPRQTWNPYNDQKGSGGGSTFWQKDAFANEDQRYNLETAGLGNFAKSYGGVKGDKDDNHKILMKILQGTAFAAKTVAGGNDKYNTWESIQREFGRETTAGSGATGTGKNVINSIAKGMGKSPLTNKELKQFGDYVESVYHIADKAKLRPAGAREAMYASGGDLSLKGDIANDISGQWGGHASSYNRALANQTANPGIVSAVPSLLQSHGPAAIDSVTTSKEIKEKLHQWAEDISNIEQAWNVLDRKKKEAAGGRGAFSPDDAAKLSQLDSDRNFLRNQRLALMQKGGRASVAESGQSQRVIMEKAKAQAARMAAKREGMAELLGSGWQKSGMGIQGGAMFPTGQKLGPGQGSLNMSTLSTEYDKWANTLDKQSTAGEAASRVDEYKTRVGNRLAKVFEMVEERGLNVSQASRQLAAEMKRTAGQMKFEKGEISGRAHRSSSSQYYDNKVQDGAYGMSDMRGTFLSQFARNSQDDWGDLKDMIQSTATTMRTGFATAFREFASGTKSSKEAFGDMANSMLDNILARSLDFGSDNFMSYLFGQNQSFSQGGLVQGFSKGGPVKGPGTSTSDSIPGALSPGEFVIKASSARKLGPDFLNSINNRASTGGSFAAVVRNRIDYDDPKRPTSFTYNADPMLSMVGQTDTNNPQNQKKFQREEAFYTHKHSDEMRKKANAEKMAKFKKSQKQRMKAAYINAAMTVVAGVAKGYPETGVGKFLNSVGGKTLVSSGFGALMGGKEGAIMGAVGGLTAGVVGKMEAKAQAAEQKKMEMKFHKKIYDVMGDPKFKDKLANYNRTKGLISSTEANMTSMDIPGEKQRLKEMLDHYKRVPPGMDPFSFPREQKKTAGQKLREGWKGLGSKIKDAPGAAWKNTLGSEGMFTKGFWGFGNQNARGGLIKKYAIGGLHAATLGNTSSFTKMTPVDDQIGAPQVANLTGEASSVFSNLGAGGEKAFSRGGRKGFSIYGGDNSEAVRLSDGEYVLQSSAVKNIGVDAAKALNEGDMFRFYEAIGGRGFGSRGMANGGLVGESTTAPSTGSGVGGGFDAMNDNLVALLGAVERLYSLEESEQDKNSNPRDDGARIQSGGGGGSRNIANNITITVNVNKKGESTSSVSGEGQEADSKGTETDQKQDQKDKSENKRMGLMMEAKIMEVIHREQRPGGTLE